MVSTLQEQIGKKIDDNMFWFIIELRAGEVSNEYCVWGDEIEQWIEN